MNNYNPVILMRASLAEQEELMVAQNYFDVYESRAQIPKNSLVIGRYSVLPFHKELEEDVKWLGSELINTTTQHNYVADLQNWYWDLEHCTPRTWFSLEDFMSAKRSGSFVLKGQTNSKKQQWDTHMFAKTQADVREVYSRLCEDGYIGYQSIYIREFRRFLSFGIGIRNMPITEEYRFFVLDGQIIGSGFYWSQFPEIQQEFALTPDLIDRTWLQEKVIDQVAPNIRFFVVDVARDSAKGWTVVELNDGCMSGLSDVDPKQLYSNMYNVLNGVEYAL